MRSKIGLVVVALLLATMAIADDPEKDQNKQVPGPAASVQAPKPQTRQIEQPTVTRTVAPNLTPNPSPAERPHDSPNNDRQRGGNGRGGDRGHGGYDYHYRDFHRSGGFVLDFGFSPYPVYESYPVPAPYPVPVPYPVPASPSPNVYVLYYGADPVGGSFIDSLRKSIQSYQDLNLVSTSDAATLELYVISMAKDRSNPAAGAAVSVSYVWLIGNKFITSQMLDVAPTTIIDNALPIAAYAERLITQYR